MSEDRALTPEMLAAGREFVARLLAGGVKYQEAVRRFKELLVEAALEKNQGSKSAAGRQLDIERDYVRRLARRP